jgi:uncharacterized protein YuzE
MRMNYDGEGDTLDILVKDGQIHHAVQQDQIIINYDEAGDVVELEILNASKFLGEFLTGILRGKPKAKLVEIG